MSEETKGTEEEREKREITTPVHKHRVVLKAWITGRERMAFEAPFLDAMQLEVRERRPEFKKIEARKLAEETIKATIETVVVSVDGNKENRGDRVLDMHGDDYDFVMKEIDKVKGGFPKPEQKQEGTTGSGS